MKTAILTLILLLATSTTASAQSSVAADNGRTLAQRWCASCHDISGTTSSDAAPGFRALAGRSDVTAQTLSDFLKAPHPPMPDLMLSRNEIAELVAYIESLKQE